MKIIAASKQQEHKRAARKAGLRYVTDTISGIRRKKSGKGFHYLTPQGHTLKDPTQLRRIRALVIPPAWQDVWISPYENGHIQATGKDARGRKQYRYHADWIAQRSETKFSRMRAFAEALPHIRQQVDQDLRRTNTSRDKVIAAVIRLMEKSYVRIGNEEYAKANKSYGLTTLRDRHVEIEGNTIRLEFNGKKGVKHAITLNDRRLARIVKKCKDIPGYELFQYYDEEGRHHPIDSGDINDYLRAASGQDFTAKDFRTWAGSVEALSALLEMEHEESEAARKKILVDVVKQVARSLGNTPAVCRKYYIHPLILSAYESGRLHHIIAACERSAAPYLSEEECLLVRFLEEG